MAWSAIVGALFAAAAAFFVARANFAWPLRRLAEALEADRASGVLPGFERTDEIGRIARALDRARAAREAAAIALVEARERERAEDEIAERSREMRRNTDARAAALVKGALKTLATGDLTVRVGEACEYGPGFDRAAQLMDKTVRAFAASATAISEKTAEIREAAGELSQSHEAGVANTDVARVARAASEARRASALDVAGDAREAIVAIGLALAERQVAMREGARMLEIAASSAREISQATQLIDEIAFQTHLIGINAAVEAARAGETGRGIAVVAQEMRNLSQRSRNAAKGLNAKMTISTAQACDAAARMRETETVLTTLQAATRDLDGRMSEISASLGASPQLADFHGQEQRGRASREGELIETIADAGETLLALIDRLSALSRHFVVDPAPDRATRRKNEVTGSDFRAGCSRG